MAVKKQLEILNNPLFVALILGCIIALGAFLRFTGINWDEGYHLHPDERFLRKIACGLGIAHHVVGHFPGPPPVALHQRSKGVRIALLALNDKLSVRNRGLFGLLGQRRRP